MPGGLDVWWSGGLVVWMSGCLVVWMSGGLDVWWSGGLDVWWSGCLATRGRDLEVLHCCPHKHCKHFSSSSHEEYEHQMG